MERKRHIAFFLPTLGGGGAERVMLNLARHFHQNGHRVDFFLMHDEGAYRESVPQGIRVLSFKGIAGKRFKAPQSLIPLTYYLYREHPDALIAAMNPCNLIAIAAKMISRARTKIVATEHNTFSLEVKDFPWLERNISPPLMKFLYPRCDVIVATTRGMADDLSDALGIKRERFEIIYNPVFEPKILEKSKQKATHPFFGKKSEGVLINVGNLNRQKNHIYLIEAFKILKKRKDVRLIILGEGENRKMLEKMIDDANLREFVSMPGFVDNPYAYVAQSNVFVFSSLWEGLPTVLIEALACGTPVVSTDCPTGPAEVLNNGKYGKLVPVNDPMAFANAIEETLDDPPDSQKLRERANYFSVETAASQYLEVLGF